MDTHSLANIDTHWSKLVPAAKVEDTFSNGMTGDSNANSPSNSPNSHHDLVSTATPETLSGSPLPFVLRAPSRPSSAIGHNNNPSANVNNNSENHNGYGPGGSNQVESTPEKHNDTINASYLPSAERQALVQSQSQVQSSRQALSQSPALSQPKSKPQAWSNTQKSSTQPSVPAKSTKKRKVDKACVYCRRSHMTCDTARPCRRCINRNIGHLCHDQVLSANESSPTTAGSSPAATAGIKIASAASSTIATSISAATATSSSGLEPQSTIAPMPTTDTTSMAVANNINGHLGDWALLGQQSILSQTIGYNQTPVFYSEQAGSEFSSLNEFLSMIDDSSYEQVNNSNNSQSNPTDPMSSLVIPDNYPRHNGMHESGNEGLAAVDTSMNLATTEDNNSKHNSTTNLHNIRGNNNHIPYSNTSGNINGNIAFEADNQQPRVSQAARDKFFLTAADPSVDISPEERLKQVISAKLEAGLLQPFNYVRGYARLQKYMDYYMNQSSRQRILAPISNIRPAFRAIAQSLHDVDLVLVEEAFERMLLDYDRVFTSMAIPACLWRRTGEIYRGNKEFAGLVEVSVDDLRDGKLAIYELMSEESAVNFWEKYGQIAFDSSQKAVLTSCSLRTKDGLKRKACCFSFTIRRDRYNIPSCIVGNFIPIHL